MTTSLATRTQRSSKAAHGNFSLFCTRTFDALRFRRLSQTLLLPLNAPDHFRDFGILRIGGDLRSGSLNALCVALLRSLSESFLDVCLDDLPGILHKFTCPGSRRRRMALHLAAAMRFLIAHLTFRAGFLRSASVRFRVAYFSSRARLVLNLHGLCLATVRLAIVFLTRGAALEKKFRLFATAVECTRETPFRMRARLQLFFDLLGSNLLRVLLEFVLGTLDREDLSVLSSFDRLNGFLHLLYTSISKKNHMPPRSLKTR